MARRAAEIDERIAHLQEERRHLTLHLEHVLDVLSQEVHAVRKELERLMADERPLYATGQLDDVGTPYAGLVGAAWRPVVGVQGRLIGSADHATVTIECLLTSGIIWRPAHTALLDDGQTVTLVDQGTTRPGPVPAGSLIRFELAVTPDEIRKVTKLTLSCRDVSLVVALFPAA